MNPTIIRLDARIGVNDDLLNGGVGGKTFVDAQGWYGAWIDRADVNETTDPKRIAFDA